MGRGGSNKGNRRRRPQLNSEKGYLLISTLFFLMFSGLFAQSMIKITSNQIIQFRQISSAYQAKSALNMSKELLRQEIDRNEIPDRGTINTSMGPVTIKREKIGEEYTFDLTLTINSGEQYSKQFIVSIPKPEEELLEESKGADETEKELEEEIGLEKNEETPIIKKELEGPEISEETDTEPEDTATEN